MPRSTGLGMEIIVKIGLKRSGDGKGITLANLANYRGQASTIRFANGTLTVMVT